jgi:acetoin utilization protein AcuB
MFVKDYMTRHPVLVHPDMTIVEAQAVMSETKIRHLPVVEEGKRLLGLLTRERMRIPPTELASLNVWEITRFLSNMRVKDVMVERDKVVTIAPDLTLEEAAQIMVYNKIGCLVVIQEDVVVGVITDTDMLVELADLLGADQPGVRATVRVPNQIGEFAKLTGAIAAQGWGIYASGGVPAPKRPDYWDCVVKVRNVSKDELVAVLNQIEGHEVIDARETR